MLFLGIGIANSSAQDADALRHRLLQMSHATRIDETGTEPWHMSVSYQLFDKQGGPLETGTLEEWWAAPGMWKITIDSPSYKSTTIENRNGDFRTSGVGPIPLSVRAIERNLVYPAPIGEDLRRIIPQVRREKLEDEQVDCIALGEATAVVQFPSYCPDSADDSLKEIRTGRPWSLIRNRITSFQGHFVSLSLAIREGKRNTSAAEVTSLSQLSVSYQMSLSIPGHEACDRSSHGASANWELVDVHESMAI